MILKYLSAALKFFLVIVAFVSFQLKSLVGRIVPPVAPVYTTSTQPQVEQPIPVETVSSTETITPPVPVVPEIKQPPQKSPPTFPYTPIKKPTVKPQDSSALPVLTPPPVPVTQDKVEFTPRPIPVSVQVPQPYVFLGYYGGNGGNSTANNAAPPSPPAEPEVDRTAPAPVVGVSATTTLNHVRISWNAYTDTAGDFNHFNIYRLPTATTTISVLTPIGHPTAVTSTFFMDTTGTTSTTYYYTVTVVDTVGNESSPNLVSGSVVYPNFLGTVYEDAEDLSIGRWQLHDTGAGAASITNATDTASHNRVIEVRVTDLDNQYYTLFDADGVSNWHNTSSKFLQFDLKTTSEAYEFVRVDTATTTYYLKYSFAAPTGLVGGSQVSLNLDTSLQDGEWHTVTRDLQSDLRSAVPSSTIVSVEFMRAASSQARYDNVALLNSASVPKRVLAFIPSYGQSLSTGYAGDPALTTVAQDRTLMFKGGMTYPGAIGSLTKDLSDLIPAREADVETGWVRFGQKLASLNTTTTYLVSVGGVASRAYSALAKDTDPYNALLGQVSAAKNYADAYGMQLIVPGIAVVHGESDEYLADYGTNLIQWQIDFERDIKAITNQTQDVPMFHTQTSYVGGPGVTLSSCLMVDAADAAPGKVILVGPKYVFPYYVDGTHLINTSYRWMGAYYAKVIDSVVNQGRPWIPVEPTSIGRVGNIVTVQYNVPVGSLVFDDSTSTVSDPLAGGPGAWGSGFASKGFEFVDNGSSTTSITGVSITGTSTVQIVLSKVPVGGSLRLRYAYLGGNAVAGPLTGPRGNLRDTDPAMSLDGQHLYNWAVSFDKPSP